MDPLSITFGVVGTAGVALHSLRKLKIFISNIKRAPKAINDLSADLNALQPVLQILKDIRPDSNAAVVELQKCILTLLEQPLHNCTSIVESITDKLAPFVDPTTKSKRNGSRHLLWAYREKEFKDLKNSLQCHKSTLAVTLSAANFMFRISKQEPSSQTSTARTDIEAACTQVTYEIRTQLQKIENDVLSITGSAGSSTVPERYSLALKICLQEVHHFFDNFSERGRARTPQSLHDSKPSPVPALNTSGNSPPDHRLRRPTIEEQSVITPRSVSPTEELERTSTDSASPTCSIGSVSTELQHGLFCKRNGCILPSLFACVKDTEEKYLHDWNQEVPLEWNLDRLYPDANLSADTYSKLDDEIVSKPHLYGYRARNLTTRCPSYHGNHVEVLRKVGRRPEVGEIACSRGDILQIIEGDFDVDGWRNGRLGQTDGIYPQEDVEVRSFQTCKSWRLVKALQGQPLLNEHTSKILADASAHRDEERRAMAISTCLRAIPRIVLQIFDVVITVRLKLNHNGKKLP